MLTTIYYKEMRKIFGILGNKFYDKKFHFNCILNNLFVLKFIPMTNLFNRKVHISDSE